MTSRSPLDAYLQQSSLFPSVRSLFDVVSILKASPRSGLVDFGVPNPFSIWDHTLSVSRHSYYFAEKLYGQKVAQRCRLNALAHDLPESLTPDFTPNQNVPKEVKADLEYAAIKHIGSLPPAGQQCEKHWLEYEEGSWDHVWIVKGQDKLDAAREALFCEQHKLSRYNMEDFYRTAHEQVKGTPLEPEFNRIYKQRPLQARSRPSLVRAALPCEDVSKLRHCVLNRISSLSLA